MQGRKLLINTMLKAKLIEIGIPKHSLIITMNSFQIVGMLIIQPQSHALKVFKHFILAFQEENLRVMRVSSTMTRTYHLLPMEQTREGPTMSKWNNCPGCSIVIVLIGEWDGNHLAMTTRGTNQVTLKLEQGQSSE
jgi:hypothetical protein